MAQTVEQRWSALAPGVRVYGPADGRARPAVIGFHGCGGVRPRLIELYARAAVAQGCRVYSVNSYAHRRWSRAYALGLICSGAVFRGPERAGDVLAAVHGLRRRPDVDPSRLMLAGWSHGAWSIMDLMTMPLVRPGEAGLADPDPAPLAGVRSVFLAYPYGGLGALSRSRPWLRKPDVLGVVAGKDHVTNIGDARRLYRAARAAGARVEVWEAAEATHAFDEEGPTVGVMRHHAALSREAVRRFDRFVGRTLA